MIIYHGSKQIIEKPIVGGSNPTNDYGPAFYMTLDLESAKSWSCKNDSLGIVNKYYVDNKKFSELKILDLTDKKQYSVLNWIAILMHFRELDSSFKRTNLLMLEWLSQYYIDINEYDVVIGFRADDSYFRFPIKFVSNDLSIEDLENVFMLGHLGIQYAFISKKSIDLLKFMNPIECEQEYLGHYYLTVKQASKEFDEILNVPRDPRKHYIIDLMRGEK